MSELNATRDGFWQTRYSIIAMCFAATFVCYIDRVNISVAIIPMADDYGWNLETQGYILSSFYIGYLLMQIGGGRLADTFGGKVVLGAGGADLVVFYADHPLGGHGRIDDVVSRQNWHGSRRSGDLSVGIQFGNPLVSRRRNR